MKLYVDADLKVMKKSNDEALQVSRLRSSTQVWCIDVSRAPVQRCSGRRFKPVFQEHNGMQLEENTPILRTFQTSRTHVREREGRERECNGMNQGV
jgi:hypothetical protein